MKSIIDALFYDTVEKPANQEETKISAEESEIFEKLSKSLSDVQKQLLLSFDDLKNARHLEQEKVFFSLGFQAGAKTVLEIFNVNITK